MIKAVIFDLDGVIVDNEKYHKKAWEIFFNKHCIYKGEEKIKQLIVGRGSEATIRVILHETNPKEIKKLVNEKEDIYISVYKNHVKPVKYLVNFIKTLKKDYKIGLATSTSKKCADFIIDSLKIRNLFNTIITKEDVKKLKPAPDVYLETAKRLKVKPKDCLVFEDSNPGLKAAKKAGMYCVAITTSLTKEQIKNADRIINSFKGLTIKKLLN